MRFSGSLANMLTVYAGPTAGGAHQVQVSLNTSDPDGDGRHTSVMTIDPDTSAERRAAIVHEIALGLLSHELLEQLTDDRGVRILDPHGPDGAANWSPGLTPHARASGHVGVTLVKPAEQSYTGEGRLTDCGVEAGVAEFVRRLNHPIFGDAPYTVASCEGHGTPATVTMADGATWSRQEVKAP